jgi:hypothetical protein
LDAEQRAALALERRVRAMASRWRYSPADLRDALDAARAEPAAWLAAVAWDEELTERAARDGSRWPP